tara:strand:- start:40 stop:1185 length:1146 start_codon:yes stop_codon:yes gene_type:complete
MEVAVIGRGTAAIVTSLQLIKYGHKVSIFYDPFLKPINVGESSTPIFTNLIQDVLNIKKSDLIDLGIFSEKVGINFVDWGNGNQFYHGFFRGDTPAHFQTEPFNQYIHQVFQDRDLIEYYPHKVNDIKFENDKAVIDDKFSFDFVVSCTGWADDDCDDVIIESVNSVILFKKNYEQYSKEFTLHLATEDGWQFGIPFPKQNIFKCGYLYNNNFISKEEVINKIGDDYYESFTWQPKSSKTMIKNNFHATNGNRLFFFEPLEALTLHYFVSCGEKICNFLDNRSEYNMDRINSLYNRIMYENQMILAYVYHFGSVYDSEYWKHTKEKSIQLLNGSHWGTGDRFERKIEADKKYNLNFNDSLSRIGIFEWQDLLKILDGMTHK